MMSDALFRIPNGEMGAAGALDQLWRAKNEAEVTNGQGLHGQKWVQNPAYTLLIGAT